LLRGVLWGSMLLMNGERTASQGQQDGCDRCRVLNPLTLCFAGAWRSYEQQFIEEYHNKSVLVMRGGLLILMYCLFGLLDLAIDPENCHKLWYIRYAIILPGALAYLLAMTQPWVTKTAQPMSALLMVFGGFGIVAMINVGNEVVRAWYVGGVYLTVIGVIVLLRIRFVWAWPSALLIVLGYVVTGVYLPTISMEQALVNTVFLVSFTLIGLVACYLMEQLARREFMGRVELEKERESVREMNRSLEVKVAERTQALEKSHIEQQALQSRLAMTERMECVGRLAGGVAHDFNNLLMVVSGNATLAMDDLRDVAYLEEALQEICSVVTKGTDLVRQLLAFSRNERIHPQHSDVNELLRSLMSMLRRLIGEDIEVKLDLFDGVCCTLVDRGKFDQVVINLAVNARDAMPRGGEINISTERFSAPGSAPGAPDTGDWIHMMMADTGTGMAPEVLRKIYEPFFTTKEQGKGTGLGLSTVFGVATQHKAHIHVESSLGHGTEFHMYWPDTGEAKCEDDSREQEESPPCIATGQTILLAEDEQQVREMLASMLKSLGYHVVVAANGAEALEWYLANREIDLLITDMVMPKMRGGELAAEIRKHVSDMPVLFISGYSTEFHINGDQDNLGEHDRFLEKSFSRNALKTVLDELFLAG